MVLEPDNLKHLQEGKPLDPKSEENGPVYGMLIAYTPDLPWVQEQVAKRMKRRVTDDASASENIGIFDQIINESLSRPPVHDRPYHPPVRIRPGETT